MFKSFKPFKSFQAVFGAMLLRAEFQFLNFVLFAAFVVKCLFRFWLQFRRARSSWWLSSLIKMKILHAIVDQHGTFFLFRHPGEILFHDLDRVRELACRMGEVGAPDQFIDANAVAPPDSHRIVQKPPVIVLLEVFARITLQTIEPPVVMDHPM